MHVLKWARAVKPYLVDLQSTADIPALWAAAQMVHESAVQDGQALSVLAGRYHNYAGLKWADWQRPFGCSPVALDTWEEINGQSVKLEAAFCACPSWEAWLQVYAHVLDFGRYRSAKQYRHDPLLYGLHVWQAGWATDSRYLTSVAGWMTRLYPDYADTLPRVSTDLIGRKVEILDAGGRALATGWLMDPDGPGPEGYRTVARVADLAAALGMTHLWDGARSAVSLLHPGIKKEEPNNGNDGHATD